MATTRERYLEWKNRCLLPQLPVELWAHIFSYLQINDLFSIRLVSRLFYSCINQHTSFWSSVIFNIDECSNYLVTSDLIRYVRSSNIDLFTKSNIYSHCTVYLKAQPLVNSTNKRRKRQLLQSHDDDDDQSSKKQLYLRCSSVHFESLRSFDQLQLEYLLKKRIRRLELSYECISNEPSLVFLLKLERLKHLKISFLHNITELNPFAIMLIRTIRDIIVLLFKLKRLKSLTICNLYLTQAFPENIYSIEHLRSIWFENCVNIHFLLSAIDKQYLKTIILRHSTCDRTILTNFLNQLHTLHYLDLASLQIIKTNNSNNEQLYIPSKVKICSLNNTILEFSSFHSHASLRSLELIDINIKQLSNIFNTCQSLQIVCLFFSIQQYSLSSIIKYFQQHQYSQLLIHLHLLSIDDNSNDEKHKLPSNILIIPTKESLCCFCYRNLI